MKIIELEISNIRGIRDLKINLDEKNLVIWGPNGSGKSAVVDAIDFLLTGHITRLEGKGTGDISLNKHGPHIDHKSKDAVVRAIVKIPGIKNSFQISRCMAHPNDLICEDCYQDALEPILIIAQRGEHVLTRREILKFITSDPATRAESIQLLLNINDIEEIRKSLVKVRTNSQDSFKNASNLINRGKESIARIIHQGSFDEKNTLDFINHNRKILGAQPITTISFIELKKGVSLPKGKIGEQSINTTLIETDILNLKNMLSIENKEKRNNKYEGLHKLIDQIISDSALIHLIKHVNLIEKGLDLIDVNGACPLCDTPWPKGELREYLAKKISLAAKAQGLKNEIDLITKDIESETKKVLFLIEKLISTLRIASLTDEKIKPLENWQRTIQQVIILLDDSISNFDKIISYKHSDLFSPDKIETLLDEVLSFLKAKYPDSTPEQTSWDVLTSLELGLSEYENSLKIFKESTAFQTKASSILQLFIDARDEILGNIYNGISERFIELYKSLHGADENGFVAGLVPDGAGLKFEVDFYGRGSHPPQALHSEGHQDSMGLCLFLALAEKLTGGFLDITILDDVVMSIDTNHRKQICNLLKDLFPNRQFIITTHDKTWAKQLSHNGVVTSKRVIEFYNWQIETGPHINFEPDLWVKIQDLLERGNVSESAFLLRKGSEELLAEICDSIEAQVKFSIEGLYEFGDLLTAAQKRYSNLLKKAKNASQSWSDTASFEKFGEMESISSSINQRIGVENWAINPNIHYNNWAIFALEDFLPVVEVFQDFFGLFICQKCGGRLYITKDNQKESNLRCDCGKFNWNLIEKP